MNLSIIITLTTLTYSLFKPQSKYLAKILLIFLFLIFSLEIGPDGDSDFYMYKEIFNQVSSDFGRGLGYEWLFVYIFKFASQLGLSFFSLRIIISFLETIFIYKIIHKYSKNTAYILSLFIVYPAIIDAELFRQLLGLTIVLMGLPRLVDRINYKDDLIYLLFVFIASGIHSSCYFFLSFYFIRIKKIRNLFLIISVILFLYFTVFDISLIIQILGYLPFREFAITKYENMTVNSLGRFYFVLKQLVSLILALICLYIYKEKNTSNVTVSSTEKKLFDFFLRINIVMFLVIIPCSISVNAGRLIHILLLVNYIMIANTANYLLQPLNRFCLHILGLCYSIIYLFLDLFIDSSGTLEVFIRNFTDGYLVHLIRILLNVIGG